LQNDLAAVCVEDVTPFSQSGGTLEINDDCTITYTPPMDFTGIDNFVYTSITEEFATSDNEELVTRSSAEVEVLVVDGELDSLYVQEEIICSEQLETYFINFYFPFVNDNYHWRLCGESEWQIIPSSPMILEFDAFSYPGYCLEFVDLDHLDDIVVKEKDVVVCEYAPCCFQNFQVFSELECDSDSIYLVYTLGEVAATQNYQWKHCWSDTWNEISVISDFSEPFLIKDAINSDICLEFRNVTCNDHYFAIWEENVNCTVTSIELFSLNGKAEGKYNEINWRTASETKNAYFILERSEDGEHFTPITRVSGHGNSNTVQKYYYNDFINKEKAYYYRLAAVDFDGNQERMSKVILIERDSKPRLNVFPNPTSQFLQIHFSHSTKEKINWQITNIDGRKVMEGFTEEEDSQLKIGVEDLPNGTYFLQIGKSGEKGHLVERFVVMK